MGTVLSAYLNTQQYPHTHRTVYVSYLKAGVLAGLVCLLYRLVLIDLAKDWWNEPALSYGMLIPPLVVYVAWLRRDQVLAFAAIPDRRGVFLTAFACVLFLLGKLGAEFFLMRISFVVLLAGLTWTFWGNRRLETLAFPFVLLATMVPLPVVVYNSI